MLGTSNLEVEDLLKNRSEDGQTNACTRSVRAVLQKHIHDLTKKEQSECVRANVRIIVDMDDSGNQVFGRLYWAMNFGETITSVFFVLWRGDDFALPFLDIDITSVLGVDSTELVSLGAGSHDISVMVSILARESWPRRHVGLVVPPRKCQHSSCENTMRRAVGGRGNSEVDLTKD